MLFLLVWRLFWISATKEAGAEWESGNNAFRRHSDRPRFCQGNDDGDVDVEYNMDPGYIDKDNDDDWTKLVEKTSSQSSEMR